MATRGSLTLLDRFLRPFSKVRRGEGALALLMLVCVFLILSSYYVMKTAREGLILAGGTWGLGGDELKTYATGAMALLLVAVIPAYGRLANYVCRIRLINISYAIVMASLVAFAVLGLAGVPVGFPFFIWLGLVNVFLIAQFWSYANDLYTEEEGKRLFAIIAVGGSLGAIAGPRIAALVETFSSLFVAAGILIAALILFNLIERLHGERKQQRHAREPITGAGGFALVLRDRYLLLIGVMLLVANLVNTTGEFVLSHAVREQALAASADEAVRRELIKGFYSDFFFWVNLVAFLLQALVVSRVIMLLGVRGALFVMPLVAFASYGVIGIAGSLALIRIAKITENATDYSLQNTVRHALFLPTDRAVKYKAKATIDTFFVRLGDTLSAVVVGVGLHQLGFGVRELVIVNLVLVAVWFAIVARIAHHHRLLGGERPPLEAPAGPRRRLEPAGAGRA
jgi:ATP:ADP antiporter, AAA family